MDDDALDTELGRIGDRLEAAIAATIDARNTIGVNRHDMDDPTPTEVSMSRSPQRSQARRRFAIGAGVCTLALAGAGVAAAFGAFSADEVAQGMPGGSAIFIDTDPTCTTADDIVFDCTLARPPALDGHRYAIDYTGSKQLFVDKDKYIAGGCIGQDVEGLRWTCYAGQRAVDEGILARDLLGEYSPEPAVG